MCTRATHLQRLWTVLGEKSISCVQRLLERVNGIDAVALALLRVTDNSDEAFRIIAAERGSSQPHRELVLVV
jgi:hypothetical protein